MRGLISAPECITVRLIPSIPVPPCLPVPKGPRRRNARPFPRVRVRTGMPYPDREPLRGRRDPRALRFRIVRSTGSMTESPLRRDGLRHRKSPRGRRTVPLTENLLPERKRMPVIVATRSPNARLRRLRNANLPRTKGTVGRNGRRRCTRVLLVPPGEVRLLVGKVQCPEEVLPPSQAGTRLLPDFFFREVFASSQRGFLRQIVRKTRVGWS